MTYVLTYLASWLVLAASRFWTQFWPALCVTAFYASLCFFNIPATFGRWAHLFLLAAFVLVIAALAFRGGRSFHWPTRNETERAMERAGRLPHQPLAALKDKPAGNVSKETQALWDKHVAAYKNAKEHVRLPAFESNTPARDPYGLRHAVILFLVIGFVVAADDAPYRLQAGLTPDIHLALPRTTGTLEAWIVPPAYTNTAPQFLAATRDITVTGKDVTVPAGSTLKIRMTPKRKHAPKLRLAGVSHALVKAGDKSYTAELPIQNAGGLVIREGFYEHGRWTLNITKDTPPDVAIDLTGKTSRAALKITWHARDDYGISSATATITPVQEKDTQLQMSLPVSEDADETIVFDMILPPHNGTPTLETIDLTAHPHAGLAADLAITVTDAAGQSTTSAPHRFILPERKFTNPLAQRLVEERKKLSFANDPISYTAIAKRIHDIGKLPELYKHDVVVYLALDAAVNRLTAPEVKPAVKKDMQRLLWDVALKLEDGGLSTAARDLSAALQRLSGAMNNPNLSPQEIQQLMQDVQAAMQNYMQELARELAQRLSKNGKMAKMPPAIAEKFMKKVDFADMMKQLEELAQQDSRAALQKMAEMLQNTIDSLNVGDVEEMQEKQVKAMEALEDLQKLIEAQQSLMDKTNRLAPEDDTKEATTEQATLRQELGDIVRKISEGIDRIPEHFATADKEMKSAKEKLGASDAPAAVLHQKAALDALQQGMDQSMQAMAEQMQQVMISFGGLGSSGNRGAKFGEVYDPMGREDN